MSARARHSTCGRYWVAPCWSCPFHGRHHRGPDAELEAAYDALAHNRERHGDGVGTL